MTASLSTPSRRQQHDPGAQHIALRRGGRAKPGLKHRAIPSPQANLHRFEFHRNVESRITHAR
jgi:hypothetical protein